VIRLRFVQDHRIEFPVDRMCTRVEVPRSSFYEWSTRTPSARERADGELLEIIIEIHEASRRTYGIPRVLGQLQRRGIRIARSRVARIMRTNGLQGAHARRKWKRHRHDGDPTEDLLNRDFVAANPNERWVADFTEFPTDEGKLFPAGIRDLCHHGIVGWDTSDTQDTVLAVSALTMALARTGHPGDVIHHADHGSQYTSYDFAVTAGNANVRLSFGSVGDAFDNAAIESFWARLKVEIAWIRGSIRFRTRAEAHAYLFEFIEVFYNRQRHQAGLEHRTPAEYHEHWRQAHQQ
jgi:putative transposase